MNFRGIPLLVFVLYLTGCVTKSPEQLFTIPPDPPRGKGTVTGNFPTFEQPPVAETKQFTPTESKAMQSELAADLARSQALAAANANSSSKAEAAKLKKLALERERALQKKFEAESEEQ